MELSKAVSYRISQLLAEKNISSYKLSYSSAIPTSTISHIILCNGKTCNLSTIFNICRGLNITLAQLFNSDLFSFKNIDDND